MALIGLGAIVVGAVLIRFRWPFARVEGEIERRINGPRAGRRMLRFDAGNTALAGGVLIIVGIVLVIVNIIT